MHGKGFSADKIAAETGYTIPNVLQTIRKWKKATKKNKGEIKEHAPCADLETTASTLSRMMRTPRIATNERDRIRSMVSVVRDAIKACKEPT